MFTNYKQAHLQLGIFLRHEIGAYVHPVVARAILQLGWDDMHGLSTQAWLVLAALNDRAISVISEVQNYHIEQANEIIIGKSAKYAIIENNPSAPSFMYHPPSPPPMNTLSAQVTTPPPPPPPPPPLLSMSPASMGLVPAASYTRSRLSTPSSSMEIPHEINTDEFPALTPPSPEGPPLKFAQVASNKTTARSPKVHKAKAIKTNPVPKHVAELDDAIIAGITDIIENVSGTLYSYFDPAVCNAMSKKMSVESALCALSKLKDRLEANGVDNYENISRYTMGIFKHSELYGAEYASSS